ncbi:hypothetical protein [Microcystis phage Mvi-JY20]|uniref:Uncharacterized protein n=1 Tax=Microcystis phage Mvi-JY20 TaxID=3128146 RepID=A0AAX4QG23_9CAUD
MSDGTKAVTVASEWAVRAARRADTNGERFLNELSIHVYDELVRHLSESGKKAVNGVQLSYLGHTINLDYVWILTEAPSIGSKRKPRVWLASRKTGYESLARNSYNFQSIKVP